VSFLMKSGVKLRGGFLFGDNSVDDADPDANATILSGDIGGPSLSDNSFHVVRALSVNSGALLDGFWIINGNANVAPHTFGGGLDMSNSAMPVKRCRFATSNAAVAGGGVATLNCTSFFSDCLFIGNTASTAGGMDCQQGNPRLVLCDFSHNVTTNSGAAIRFLNCGSPVPSALFNCLVHDNLSASQGGGVLISNSDVQIFNSTIVRNSSVTGAGGIHMSNNSQLSLRSSIVYDNTSSSGSPESQQVTLSSSTLDAFHNCIEGFNRPGPLGPNNIGDNPVFVDADGPNNIAGDADDDFSLHATSPCIDTGESTIMSVDLGDADGDGGNGEALPVDFAGNPRLVDDVVDNIGNTFAGALDIGAFEFVRPYTVWCVDSAATGANTGFTWKDAFTTVQQALTAVGDPRSGGPAEVWVAAGTYKTTTTTDRSKSFELVDGAKLFGGFAGGEGSRSQRDPFANPTILSGEINTSGAKDNAFHVLNADENSIDDALVDGFVITRSFANDSPGNGGGLRIINGAQVDVQSCRFIDNHALSGGAIACGVAGTANLINCIFTGNTATATAGGALLVSPGGSMNLNNCTITGNLAATIGGGVQLIGSGGNAVLTADSSIVFGNSAGAIDKFPEQIGIFSGSIFAVHCCIQCFDGSFPGSTIVTQAPKFVNAAGPDGNFGTLDDDVRLLPFSPCIDMGSILNVTDPRDLDDDGDVAETLPFDAAMEPRQHDDPNAGLGLLDIGAHEFQVTSSGPEPVFADLNGDGVVDGADLGLLLASFDTNDPVADLNTDCTVDGADLGLLLSGWTQ
jgi:predicted outer membrane repeat protein